MALVTSLHIIAACIWVGGMFFAYLCLRPVAADLLEPPVRLRLWRDVFTRFFKWVILCVAVILVSGHTMIALYGGMKIVGLHVHVMLLLGYSMFAIFGHVYFVPFKRLKQAVNAENWPEGANQLNSIRKLVGLNLLLGLSTIAVASAGRFI